MNPTNLMEFKKEAELLKENQDMSKSKEIKEQTEKEVREKIIKDLSETHKENFAFMTIKNEKGELEDWMIPFSEIVKIIKK